MDFIAKFLGMIMNGIFIVLDKIDIHSAGLGIILFTLLVYLLLLPLSYKQQKFSKVQSKITPELQRIQDKYKGKNQNPEAMAQMNQETKALYKKFGASPSSGCLPMLIQMPILFALYSVIANMSIYVPTLVDAGTSSEWYYFLGLNIAASPAAIIKDGVSDGSVWLVIGAITVPVLSAVSQWFSSWLIGYINKKNSLQSNSSNEIPNPMRSMNIIMPIISGIFSITLPVGLGIYWIAGAVIRCVQQIALDWWIDHRSKKNDKDAPIYEASYTVKDETDEG